MRNLSLVLLVCLAAASWACSECIGPSHNKRVPKPAADEYQLVMDNWVSRDMPVYVDGKEVGSICGESDLVIVGNFQVNECTRLQVFEEVNYRKKCDLTPCGGLICEQVCSTVCHDTRPYAGMQFDRRMCWEGQCTEETR
jgi:hypothetical protein